LSKSVCSIAFLTHEPEYVESTKAKEEAIAVLVSVKKQYHEKAKEATFVWVNALEHGQKLIRDFGISDQYPSLITLIPGSKQYKLLRTAFEESSILLYLDSPSGKVSYSVTPTLDAIIHTEL
jgi:hypothetical protein